jgi:uncharacterized protein
MGSETGMAYTCREGRIMDLKDVITRLQGDFPGLQERHGLASLHVFGSVARHEAGLGSDVDLLVAFLPGRICGFFGFYALQQELEDLLGSRVDLVVEEALKPQFKEGILAEAVRAA